MSHCHDQIDCHDKSFKMSFAVWWLGTHMTQDVLEHVDSWAGFAGFSAKKDQRSI